MKTNAPEPPPTDPVERARRIDSICDRFEAAWRDGQEAGGWGLGSGDSGLRASNPQPPVPSPRIEDYLGEADDSVRRELLDALFAVEFSCRLRRGETPRIEDYLQRFPADTERFAHIPSDVAKDRTVGHYQLLKRLGVGSFASVYLALDTRLHRTVALKLSHGHWNEHAEAAFEREAKAAAQLDHPHIVRVFDFGRHDFGHHDATMFIAAQYVAGPSLKEWRRERPVKWAEAALLCARLAAAVHHAHQRGVIHRDLKPANIILDEQGDPHITDFGLAKWSDDATLTGTGDLKGTPAYMSPEQARGGSRHVTIQSDVYALGVILYELLTGARPFDGTADQVLRRVMGEAPRPPRRLNPAIPQDLETVCLKALAKEPSGRYATAEELAADLDRVLRGEPIQARPVGLLSRAVLWGRREPRLAISTAAAVVLLVVVAVVATASAWSIGAARDEAENNAAKWQRAEGKARKEARLSQSLGQLIEAADPMAFRMAGQIGPHSLGFGFPHEAGSAAQLESILDNVNETIEGRLLDRPEVRARLLEALANGYRSLGRVTIARAMFEEVIRLRQRIPDERSRRLGIADAEFYLAWLLLEDEKREEAKAFFEKVANTRAEVLGKPHDPDVIAARAGTLATILAGDNRFGDFTTQVGHLLEMLRLEGQDTRVLAGIHDYFDARAERMQHHLEQAQRLYDQVLENAQAILGDEHPVLAMLLVDAAGMRRETGDYQRAEQLIRRALAMTRKFFGAHPKLAEPLRDFAGALVERGDFDEALQYYREALMIAERHRRDDVALHAQLRLRIGETHLRAGNCRQAAQALTEALNLLGDAAQGEPRDALVLRLVEAQVNLGNLDVARSFAGDLRRRAERQRQSDEVGESLRLVRLLRELDQKDEADRLSAWALAVAERHMREKTSLSPNLNASLAEVFQQYLRWADSQEMFQRALTTERAWSPAGQPIIAQRCRELALAMMSRAKHESADQPTLSRDLLAQADKLLSESLDIRARCFGSTSHFAAESLLDRGQLRLALGQKDQAQADAKDALAHRRRLHGSPHLFTARALRTTSRLMRQVGNAAEADKHAAEARQMFAKLLPLHHPELAESALASVR